MDDPTDGVWGRRQQVSKERVRRPRRVKKLSGGMDTAPGLAQYFLDAQQEWVDSTGTPRIGRNVAATVGFFSSALNLGVEAEVLKEMVDLFFTESKMLKQGGPLWKVFVRNAEVLRGKVADRIVAVYPEIPRAEPRFAGSIPQHILDEVLALEESA